MLEPQVNLVSDNVLGPADAEMTLVEYGSYACHRCHAVHEVIEQLRDRFGDQMRYVFRQLPGEDNPAAVRAAELALYAGETTGQFWPVHEALMERGPELSDADLEEIAREFGLPPRGPETEAAHAKASARVRDDMASARKSGALATPAFFINGKRYRGAWDVSSLADAMLGTLGHRIQSAAFQFVGWGPSSGLLLGLATLLALGFSNSPLAGMFNAFWDTALGFQFGNGHFAHSLLHWVNHGLLTIFFVVVGLEIKREFTVGHLKSFRSGALPVLGALGGILLPALIYMAIAPAELRHGWGIPIGTDTAFAVALIVLLGTRVPIELRVFLTAAVIIDDVVAIAIIAFFYTGELAWGYLLAGGGVSVLLLLFNRVGIHGVLPYVAGGVVLWFLLHEAGLHATLAGVIVAMLMPTRPPANMKALLAQAAAVIHEEDSHTGEAMRSGPSEHALSTLDAIHDRMESPADKVLRSVEPWSSYFVLPVFALANAGVEWSSGVFEEHGRMMLAIAVALVLGKSVGIIAASWLAVRSGIARKPEAYSWRQLAGAGALGGIGFTMSLFIASQAFADAETYAAAKIAIFIASIVAAIVGVCILFPQRKQEDEDELAA